jgi:hypothetical protein
VIVDVARLRAAIPNHLVRQRIELEKVDSDIGLRPQRCQDVGDKPPSRPHLLDLGRRSILDHPEILPYVTTSLRKLQRHDAAQRAMLAPAG